ncbi:Down syndrome cell adhesion molecule [Plakobranchus ocellatus]|uniref:Down syndrome cell adhesion molecule n=1 Tax=Plakobranchus ocellatus TaxID=259542 RepID=A0AAV3YLW6_9GAST|nr:Down syndrome cell adhesion molecule [Plakobranchus ocellatus]
MREEISTISNYFFQVTWRRLGEYHFLSVGDLPWVKDPNLLVEFRELTPEVTEWNLIIKNVTPAHEGTYECKISDKNELFRHIHLKVVDLRPPITISGKNFVETGQPIRLFCNVSGPDGMYLKVDWFKDGDSMQYPSARNAIITNYNLVETNVLVSELFIDHSHSTDSGTYICRSTMGIKSFSVTVLFADSTGDPEGETPRSGCRRQHLDPYSLLAWAALAFVMISLWNLRSPIRPGQRAS